MKNYIYILLISIITFACGGSDETSELVVDDGGSPTVVLSCDENVGLVGTFTGSVDLDYEVFDYYTTSSGVGVLGDFDFSTLKINAYTSEPRTKLEIEIYNYDGSGTYLLDGNEAKTSFTFYNSDGSIIGEGSKSGSITITETQLNSTSSCFEGTFEYSATSFDFADGQFALVIDR